VPARSMPQQCPAHATVHSGLELMTSLVMVDGQRLAHHYSSRVFNSDPYLTDVFPAKEHLRHPVPEWTSRKAARSRATGHEQIVGTIGKNAQGTLVIAPVGGCCSGLRRMARPGVPPGRCPNIAGY
jgi:hypothetical protein